jgi:hypothetical protein
MKGASKERDRSIATVQATRLGVQQLPGGGGQDAGASAGEYDIPLP